MDQSKTPVVKYNYELLLSCMKRDNSYIDLSVYTKDSHLTSKVRIDFVCNCGTPYNKCFRNAFEQAGFFCKTCTDRIREEKQIKTNNERYNQSWFSNTDEYKQQVIDTCQEKYKVNNVSQLEQVKEKKKETTRKHFNVDHPLQSKINQEKAQQTMEEKYGDKFPGQVEEIKEKSKETSRQRYKCDYPNQDPNNMKKIINNSFKRKKYIFPSGVTRTVQGYEPQALDILLKTFSETDIITDCTEVPEIWWKHSNETKLHRHFVDIYIKSINTCIEVKSTRTFKVAQEDVLEKQKAGKMLNMNYEIWILDNKGNILDILK